MLLTQAKKQIWSLLFMTFNVLYQRRRIIKLILFAFIMIAGFSLHAAGIDDLKKGVASILQVIMIISFPLAVAMGIYAGFLYSKGQTQEAKQAIISTGIIAAAPIIAYVMYEAMGLGDFASDIEDGDF